MRAVPLVLALWGAGTARARPPDLDVFTRAGCPRCADAMAFLDALVRDRPDLEVVVHDVGEDPAALARLRTLARERGVTALGVPAFLVGGELVVGFAGAGTTGVRLRALLAAGRAPPPAETVRVPLLGELDTRTTGLLGLTLVLGLLDGFNPCAMWVLLFLLALLVHLHDRRKMVAIAGTFVVVSGAAYYAFMAAWVSVFLLVGVAPAVRLVLGTVAVGIGALNVKDFFAFGRGPSIGIPERAKPGVYARVRGVVQAERLGAAVAGAAVLAVLVNVVELLCTAGLPAVYTRILTLHVLPPWQYYGFLLIYAFVYMLDDAVMVGLAVAGLGRMKLQERGGRWLKLVSGVVMLGLGVALLATPDRLP
jgi:hypothetical protein